MVYTSLYKNQQIVISQGAKLVMVTSTNRLNLAGYLGVHRRLKLQKTKEKSPWQRRIYLLLNTAILAIPRRALTSNGAAKSPQIIPVGHIHIKSLLDIKTVDYGKFCAC
jgi:hypothetical protein